MKHYVGKVPVQLIMLSRAESSSPLFHQLDFNDQLRQNYQRYQHRLEDLLFFFVLCDSKLNIFAFGLFVFLHFRDKKIRTITGRLIKDENNR